MEVGGGEGAEVRGYEFWKVFLAKEVAEGTEDIGASFPRPCVSVCARTQAREQSQMSFSIALHHFFVCFVLEAESLTEPGVQLAWLPSEPWGPSCLCSPVLGSQAHTTVSSFLWWGSNSGPDGMAVPLSTEPSGTCF